MSLLDDVKGELFTTHYSEGEYNNAEWQTCRVCGDLIDDEHTPSCLAARVVAVLEAAEKTLRSLECFPKVDDSGYVQHIIDGMKRDLVAALRGEQP